jgi:hypothetical protein
MTVVLIWCATLAIYLLFAGQISWHETLTGIVLASLSTTWRLIIRSASQRHFKFLSDFLRPLGRGFGQLFPASLATAGVLVRVAFAGGAASHTEIHDFVSGASGGACARSVDRARRALAVLLASCAPDRFVFNVDRESGTVLIHAIVPAERELDPQWLT